MLRQLQRFVTTFRELEKEQFAPTPEEERRWKLLKEKLGTAPVEIPEHHVSRRILAVASFYPQAGASFLAGNLAYLQAGKQMHVTLCEMPGVTSYFYFALDSERRAESCHKHPRNASIDRLIPMQGGRLRIRVEAPFQERVISQTDLTNWFLANSREASLLVIDVSSNWKEERAAWIAEWADEIWFVLDADLPRLARLVVAEQPPLFWQTCADKIRVIANKWNDKLKATSVLHKVEGTLSLWNTEKRVEGVFPLIDAKKASKAHLSGQLLLESCPEEEPHFEQLPFFI